MAGASFVAWFAVITAVSAFSSLAWYHLVQKEVPGPYLDEVFHVRQAQVYCAGDFRTWDPKITTPPGVYLLSYLVFKITGYCDISSLRALNRCIPAIIAILSSVILDHLNPSRSIDNDIEYDKRRLHRGVNIALFPPLFFFSALYYTDVASTASVLLAFLLFLKSGSTFGASLAYVISGLVALSFRQTNIFWVAVFPLALRVIAVIQGEAENSHDTKARSSAAYSLPNELYDPPVGNAYFEDYIKTGASLVTTAVTKLPSLLIAGLPSFALLGSFAAFVVVNGGVVLGDKSNHIASLHIPQMLYLWPYILFFSWPIIGPNLLASAKTPYLSTALRGLALLIAFTGAALVAVHFNTVIHPFTLADNRHYVFYVFRLLRVYPALRYLATPIYIISAWAVIQMLGYTADSGTRSSPRAKLARQPAQDGPRTSLVLAWLASTTLNLVTAPLVEPRYCILPWIFWRLYVPQRSIPPKATGMGNVSGTESGKKSKADAMPPLDDIRSLLGSEDFQLWMETALFLLINAVTGYLFLYKDFAWVQEPGQKQRFMW